MFGFTIKKYFCIAYYLLFALLRLYTTYAVFVIIVNNNIIRLSVYRSLLLAFNNQCFIERKLHGF